MYISVSLALLATKVLGQNDSGIFGSDNPIPQQGQWLPPSPSYARGPYKQAIFLSFDGMHQFDLVDFVSQYPNSTFASLLNNAVVYSNARASSPSDSLPATAALFSGATSHHSGIFWEQSYDRSLYPGGSGCTGPPGVVCDYSEACDLNSSAIDGGGGFNLTYLPQKLTAWGTCEPVLPHNFILVNTIFEVGRANGLVTAFADKHLSYEFLNGPSGSGLSQGYFPEIASIDNTLEATEAWDDLHCETFPGYVECPADMANRVSFAELDHRYVSIRHSRQEFIATASVRKYMESSASNHIVCK
jgi:Type I phosphodiesterase / nucleotide pyrophosphatase